METVSIAFLVTVAAVVFVTNFIAWYFKRDNNQLRAIVFVLSVIIAPFAAYYLVGK
jgi:hypothetical protein